MWVAAAVAVVDQAWPPGTFDAFAWPECERLMPHSAACLQHADTFEVASEGMGDLASRMGFYLEGRAAYAEAEPLLRRALDGYERVLGLDHPDTDPDGNPEGRLTETNEENNSLERLGDFKLPDLRVDRLIDPPNAVFNSKLDQPLKYVVKNDGEAGLPDTLNLTDNRRRQGAGPKRRKAHRDTVARTAIHDREHKPVEV